MRRLILRLIVVLLTVIIGVSCAISYRAITRYRIIVLLARESVLRDELLQMRKLIDQHAADKGSLPKSLDDLVRAGYLREIPEDPITEQRDWIVVVGDDPNVSEGGEGIIDVHSASLATSREGTAYKEW
jgi:general secretion pathway protein G